MNPSARVLIPLLLLLCSPAARPLQAQQPAERIVSPDVQTDRSVIFRLKAPEAHSVQMFGTWLAARKTRLR
jgi:hypothetical protein